FRESAIRAEARPAHIGADMCVTDLAMAADSVAPSGRDHHMVAFLEARGFWNDAANLFYRPGDLVTRDYRRRDIGVVPEKSIDQQHIGSAHPAGLDLDQHLVSLDVRNRYVLKNERLLIFEYACRFHVLLLSLEFSRR